MIKHLSALAMAVFPLVGLSSDAHAATGSATINAAVLKPIVLSGGGTLNFGTIVTPSTATYSGQFKIDAASAQTTTFCAASFACTGSPTALLFNIQGTKANPISLTVPLTVTLTLQNYTGGGTTPTLTMTTANSLFANNATGTYTYSLSNSGSPGSNFYVGGTLTVDQNTVGGDYSGSFTITADYQ